MSKIARRRVVGGVLVVLGAVLMLAAPSAEIPLGALAIGVGVAIELAGIFMEHHG